MGRMVWQVESYQSVDRPAGDHRASVDDEEDDDEEYEEATKMRMTTTL